MIYRVSTSFFFFNDTATTEIYTLSLHDALPICGETTWHAYADHVIAKARELAPEHPWMVQRIAAVPTRDRKSTRLNSSHGYISYAVFCLKKKKINTTSRLYTIYYDLYHTQLIL